MYAEPQRLDAPPLGMDGLMVLPQMGPQTCRRFLGGEFSVAEAMS